jgi:hypothetical protein
MDDTSGLRRRTVLGATAAGLAVTAAGLDPTPARAGDPPSWWRYVQAPPRRTVRPARVHASTGDVTHPDGLLAPGGRVTVLRRPRPPAPPAWPAGTTATASSSHAPNNGDDGRPRSYDPGNAIDGVADTFWNDDTEFAYPDTLTVTAPQPVALAGVTVLSDADGVPADFTVETWDGAAWQPAAAVTGNAAVQRPVPFPATVGTTAVRLTVTADTDTGRGVFTRVNELWPGLVEPVPVPAVTVDFGKVVVGYPRVRFARASDNSPGVRLAFSETTGFLTDRSDFARSDLSGGGPGTDQYAVPAGGADWTDTDGNQVGDQVHAEGLHGFRYLRIALDALPSDAPAAQPWGEVAVDAVALEFSAYLGTPDTFTGWFECSDDALNRYWYAGAYTNELVTDTFRATDCDPRGAASPTLEGRPVLQDGAKRDRDPYVGDVAVSGRTLYLTHLDAAAAARTVLADLADHQRADGWIPPASINGYTLPLYDYPLWWVTASWDYLLYTGDPDYPAAYWPALVRVLDGYYPSTTNGDGLLVRPDGYGDYAFLPRTGVVTYYNANYVQALTDAAAWARQLGHGADAERWTARAAIVAAAIEAHLWDPAAGAYLDSATGPVRHAQDGNAIAVTAGVAAPDRAGAALDHLAERTARPYGNAFMDNDTIFDGASQRVYAFTSYPELVARFRTGRAASAIDQIKRMYGWMWAHDPGVTHWEGIGPDGVPYEDAFTSMAHGWSTGVVPALTNELLGAAPTAPGFSRWAVHPHPGPVTWARGRLATPHGPLAVAWHHPSPGTFTLTVTAPRGTRGAITVPTDGHRVEVRLGRRTVWRPGRPATTNAHPTADGTGVELSDLPGGRLLVTVRPAT